MKQLTLILGLIALCAACAAAREPQAAAVDTRPNIIIILADDLGYGDLSSYGASLIDTPHIDRIGADGVRMTQFYAGAAVCTPSRAALLTGRYPVRSGAQFVFRPHSKGGMNPDEVTIAELLKDAGYATGMVGKWHLGHQLEHWPTSQGFDEFYGVAYSNDMVPFDLYAGTSMIEENVDQTRLTGKYADASVTFIREHADEPFFLYYAENFPHIPLYNPPQSEGRSNAGQYGDVVETIDDAVGQILQTLEELGIADNTVLMFTSDNGPWFEGSPGPVRGRKGGSYSGGFQVPMLVRWPSVIPAGAETDEMAMSIDLLPTIAGIAGAEMPGDRQIDGKDILPVLAEGARSPHERLYFFDGNDIAAIRDRKYRMVVKDFYRNFQVDYLDQPYFDFWKPLLFDLTVDPEESYNIATRHPEIVAALIADIRRMEMETASLQVQPDPAGPPEGALVGPALRPQNGE